MAETGDPTAARAPGAEKLRRQSPHVLDGPPSAAASDGTVGPPLDGEEGDPVGTDLRDDNIELRRKYLATTRCLDAVEIHELSGSRSKDRRATARRWKRQGRILAVRRSGGDVYPAFQFEDDRPRPAIRDVLAALPDWMGCWQTAFWFASGNGWLGGETPADRLDDPEEVVRAARRAGDPAVG